MTNLTRALATLARREFPDWPHTESSKVVAIVRLSETRRSWFVTGVQNTTEGMRILGYEPGCPHSPGSRWFRVNVEFFEMASQANEERVLVEILRDPLPLDMIEDDSI